MCRCAVRQAMDVSEDGMTTSGYAAESSLLERLEVSAIQPLTLLLSPV